MPGIGGVEMKNVSTIIPCYAADTSGVCSALYELGGMTVVHDASGCNSTYSTHDEPRWYDTKSKIYISALTEMDAVMGNDEKLITDIVSAAKDQKPEFIALCGSPMPMMTGFDYRAAAQDIRGRTGIPTFGLETNGTRSYIDGASKAFLALVEEFVHDMPKTQGRGVNILGATPLDFGLNGAIDSIKNWLTDNGFEAVSCIAMDSDLDEIKKAASAKANLVISYSGYAAAKYMQKELGINFVCGVPVGEGFGKRLADKLDRCIDGDIGDEAVSFENSAVKPDTIVIGETIYARSVAAAMRLEMKMNAAAICPTDNDGIMLGEEDRSIYAEEDIKGYLAKNNIKCVIADPMYRSILPKDCRLIELPHFAFSGRCFARSIPNLINKPIEGLIK